MFRSHIESVSTAALRAKLISKSFHSRDPSLLTRAFCTFVRPVPEHCCIFRNTMFIKMLLMRLNLFNDSLRSVWTVYI